MKIEAYIAEAWHVHALHYFDALDGLFNMPSVCLICYSDKSDGSCKCVERETKFVDSNGYISVLKRRHYKKEHLLIAERVLGKPLPEGVVVHHVNKIKTDNRNENLVICENTKYHALIHARMRILEKGGDPDIDGYCPRCDKVYGQDRFNTSKVSWNGLDQMCKLCQSARNKLYMMKKSA